MADGNGSHVSRAELAAHIQRIDENMAGLRADFTALRADLKAPTRWLGARLTGVVDRALPLALVAAVTYLITQAA
ncbi:MAG: hypothetical protein NUW01_13770 [Gemmatimonadaceae bacterium]|nr:hypothetical protein [Gemmatimonadaceae bacterium]